MSFLSRTVAISRSIRANSSYILRRQMTSSLSSDASKGVGGASKETIDNLVKHAKVVVFMKGIPEEPRCGFSNAVVQILRMHGVNSYDSHDVLKDESIRQGIKDYSNWPTVPQVYIDGEFVGGCDIMVEMHQNGELIEHLKKAGIKSALVETVATPEKKE